MAAGSATPDSASSPGRGLKRYGALLALLGAATLAVHLLLLWRMSEWLDAGLQASKAPPRMQAAFVREIQPEAAAPAPAAALPAPAPARRKAAQAPAVEPPEPAASAPEPVEPEPPRAAQAAVEPTPAPEAAASEAAAASAASATASGAPAFDWPLGTRMSYVLTGSIRGEVHGSAQVEWLRDGMNYQVHLDVLVGASFAPLMQRRMTSDGVIGPQGLSPRRYDERTQVAFGSAREATLRFEPGEPGAVTLATGARAVAPAGVQDSASQFIQLTYLFATGASRLQAGQRVDLPLALPRRVDRWIYEVLGEEELHTPFGPVRAWHVKPQRVGDTSALSVEAWFAPTLRYLPVRIVIRQGKEDHLDLQVDRLPQEALEGAQAGSVGR